MRRTAPPTPPSDGRPSSPTGQDDGGLPGARRRPARGLLGQKLSGLPSGEKRSPRALAIAVGLHVLVGGVLIQALTFGHGIPDWLDFGDGRGATQERLTFLTPVTPNTPERPAAVQRSRVPAPTPVAPRPQLAPASGPVTATPSAAPAPRDTGSGAPANGIGAIDPNLRGVRPGYNDERVWRGPVGGGGGAGGSGLANGDRADKLDSIMAGMLTAARDSLDSLNRAYGRGQYGRQGGDWTKTDKNGNKWGWDQQGIRLGKVMIPNALLALLPLNAATAAGMSANPSGMANAARINAGRADIMRMSERSMGEAEFKRIVKEMDKRRDAERRERLRAPSATLAAPLKADPKPGDKQ